MIIVDLFFVHLGVTYRKNVLLNPKNEALDAENFEKQSCNEGLVWKHWGKDRPLRSCRIP